MSWTEIGGIYVNTFDLTNDAGVKVTDDTGDDVEVISTPVLGDTPRNVLP